MRSTAPPPAPKGLGTPPPNPRQNPSRSHLVTLLTTKPNLDTVCGNPRRCGKLNITRKERDISPPQTVRLRAQARTGWVVSSSKPREIRWKNLIADKWLSMVADRNLLVATEYATYSNNCHTLDKQLLQGWRKTGTPQRTRKSTHAPKCP